VIALKTVSERIDAFVRIGTCVGEEIERFTEVHHFIRQAKGAGIQPICTVMR